MLRAIAKLDYTSAAPAPAPMAAASTAPLTTETAGERRHVTVTFCDLVDSTGIAAKLDPEEWRDPVGAYLDAAGWPNSTAGTPPPASRRSAPASASTPVVELRHDGKLTAKSGGSDETRFPRSLQVGVAVKCHRWVLNYLPADPQPAAELPRCYFSDD
jgi:hypothetical protein